MASGRGCAVALALLAYYASMQAGLPSAAAAKAPAETKTPEYYFYNEVTGEVQWEDPGDVPFEDPDGTRYWVTPSGERVPWLSIQYKYAWIEQYSHELHRPFFFNQETLESTWVRPADLAWRRIRLKE